MFPCTIPMFQVRGRTNSRHNSNVSGEGENQVTGNTCTLCRFPSICRLSLPSQDDSGSRESPKEVDIV